MTTYTPTSVYVVNIRSFPQGGWMTVGVYSSLESAKKSASDLLQADALGETIEWTPISSDTEGGPVQHVIWDGQLKDMGEIVKQYLDE